MKMTGFCSDRRPLIYMRSKGVRFQEYMGDLCRFRGLLCSFTSSLHCVQIGFCEKRVTADAAIQHPIQRGLRTMT